MDASETEAAQSGLARWQPVMWLNADRVLYVGLLGEPSVRTFGAWSIYLSLSASRPHRIAVDGGAWEETRFSVVPPGTPHRIVSGERMICSILVESETIDVSSLPRCYQHASGAICSDDDEHRLRAALERFQRRADRSFETSADMDRDLFGRAFTPRAIDRRIQAVLDKIKRDPNSSFSAEECAVASHLSVSRFLHLFKDEVGSPFRSFRAWQRARSVLYYVTQSDSLANVALDAGYPDSTHFSHSVRQVYGLTPKSIFAGSRRLALYGSGAATKLRCGQAT